MTGLTDDQGPGDPRGTPKGRGSFSSVIPDPHQDVILEGLHNEGLLLLPPTGEGMNCPKILGQLGSSVLLPLTSEGLSKIMNKSIHVLVTRAESPGNSVKKKIASIYLPEGASPPYLEDGCKFHLEKPSLEIVESKRKDEAWYFITLEENVSVQSLCVQLKLYGNDGGFPRPRRPLA